ncbi:MAG: hypothetical protein ACLQHS_01965 [Candidatus Limnocylindrales bacterium]
MSAYWLYLESGPKHRKTMVHVLDPLGRVAVGPTTEAALDATPGAICAYLRRHGREVDPDAPFATQVAEHVTEGEWLGNGSPYLVFAPDLQPPTDEEIERHLEQFRWLAEDLAAWARTRTDAELDEPPGGPGRTARAILLHTLGSTGPYLAAALGDAPGFSRVATAAERGEMGIPEALVRTADLAQDRVRATTPEARCGIRESPSGPRTLRKALRRML